MGIERYSVGCERMQPVAPGEAYAELLATAGSPVSINSITVTTTSNIGGSVGLVRSTAIGTGAATGIFTGLCHRTIATQPTGPSVVQVAWTSSGATPTGSIAKLREEVMPIATGSTKTLWDASIHGPLVLEPLTSLLVVNTGSGWQGSGIAGSGLRINWTWEEGRI